MKRAAPPCLKARISQYRVRARTVIISHQHEKWTAFDSSLGSTQKRSFSIPPYLLNVTSIERDNQSIPFEELSSSESCCDFVRDASISAEQLRDEALWPEQRPNGFQQQQEVRLLYQDSQKLFSKRHASSKIAGNQIQANNSTQQQVADPQPIERMRGRPRSHPQVIEIHATGGLPIRISSARVSRLEKNRVAADKCRQRKKGYIVGLEAHAGELSSKNEALKAKVTVLREEVLKLKNEVFRHAGCGSWAVDGYLARCAGDILGVEAPCMQTPAPRNSNQAQRSTVPTKSRSQLASKTIIESLPSQVTADLNIDLDEHDSVEPLNDMRT